MTLWDAILATLNGIGAVFSAPLAVMAYAVVLFAFAIGAIIGAIQEFANDEPLGGVLGVVIAAVVIVLSISMFVWISGSYSPLDWSKP